MRIEEINGYAFIYDCYNQKEEIKLLPWRRWNPDEKMWVVPITPEYEKFKEKYKVIIQSNMAPGDFEVMPLRSDLVENYYLNFLYQHQKQSVSFAELNNLFSFADLSEAGTGKTFVQIELLLRRKDTLPALIICPKSLVDNVWVDQINKVAKEVLVPVSLNTGSTKKSLKILREIMLDLSNIVAIVNYDQMNSIREAVNKIKWKTIILDESTRIKSKDAQRSKSIIELTRHPGQYRSIMTGTIAPNSMLDIYNQYRFLNSTILGNSFYSFREKFFFPGGHEMKEWLLKQGAEHEISKLISPISIQHKKRDCVDLPPLTHEVIRLEMPSIIQEKYRDMKENLLVEINEMTTITAPFVITKMMKLRQIASGFIYDDETTHIFSNFKVAELIDLIHDINQRVIIFAHFRSSIEQVVFALNAAGIKVFNFQENHDYIHDFEKTPRSVLVANPMSAGHGLNLQFCSYMIFFEHDFALEPYLQAIPRIERIGQKNKMTVYHFIVKNTIDEYIFKKLNEKKQINDAVEIINNLKEN